MNKVFESKNSIRVKIILKPPLNQSSSRKGFSWLDYWTRLTNRIPISCHVDGCTTASTVGVHVVRMNEAHRVIKRNHYILPMCQKHSKQKGEVFLTKEGVSLAWANVRYTRENSKRRVRDYSSR